jgi:hypothetical protein
LGGLPPSLATLGEGAALLPGQARATRTPTFRAEACHLKARLLKPFLEAPKAIPQELPGHGVVGLKLHRNAIPGKL